MERLKRELAEVREENAVLRQQVKEYEDYHRRFPRGKVMPGRQENEGKAKEQAKDNEALQGTWNVIGTVSNGEQFDVVQSFIIKDATVRVQARPTGDKSGWKTESVFRMSLDESVSPRRIDLVRPEKGFNDADERREGIYIILGDTLMICVGMKGERRPTAFESTKGSGNILFILRRESCRNTKPGDQRRGTDGNGSSSR